MTVALSLLFVALLCLLMFVTAVSPNVPKHSAFERKRRANEGENMTLEKLRARRIADIYSLQRILIVILFIPILFTSIGLFGTMLGTVIVLVLALFYGAMPRFVPARRFAQRIYDEQETVILAFLDRHKAYFLSLRHSALPAQPQLHFESKDELTHLIEQEHKTLTPTEKKLLLGALRFESKMVKDLMIARDKLFTIKKSDILGPLVLDDLYKSGHDSFPVINGESEDIVGILRLREVQTLDTSRKHTARVESAMDSDLRFVERTQPAMVALEILLASQHHMLIVKDDSTVVGIITLADIINTLFGHEA